MATVQSASRGILSPDLKRNCCNSLQVCYRAVTKYQWTLVPMSLESHVRLLPCYTITAANQLVTAGHSPHFLLNLMPTRDGICNKASDGDISGVWSWSPWCTCRKGSPRTRPRRRTPAGAAQPCTARGRHIL